MAFSISYTPKFHKWDRYCSSSEPSPYLDWIKRGRPENTTFRYTRHGSEHVDEFAYLPSKNTMLLVYGGVELKTEITFNVDEANKTLHVTAVSCVCECDCDSDDDSFWKSPFNGFTEGLPMLKRALDWHNINLEFVVHQLIGVDWHVAPLPDEVPQVPEALRIAVNESSDRMYWDRGPWNKTVALYDPVPDEAATKIQAAFRGWCVRMKYRYNPYTCLGRHLILRDARELICA